MSEIDSIGSKAQYPNRQRRQTREESKRKRPSRKATDPGPPLDEKPPASEHQVDRYV